jgi:hypothetical protein
VRDWRKGRFHISIPETMYPLCWVILWWIVAYKYLSRPWNTLILRKHSMVFVLDVTNSTPS